MVSPMTGYTGGTSAQNIQMFGGWDTSENFEELLVRWETRTINFYAAQPGWSASLTRTSVPLSQNPQTWQITVNRPWGDTVVQGAYAYYLQNRKICPDGYQRNFGTYDGQPNTWYCTLQDANQQVCDSAPKPDKNRGGCEKPMEGNPCNVATGNKYEVETDFVGTGPFPLIFERHYNSSNGVELAQLGGQWRHTYDRHIRFTDYWLLNRYHSGS
jgi:hypothetical protein